MNGPYDKNILGALTFLKHSTSSGNSKTAIWFISNPQYYTWGWRKTYFLNFNLKPFDLIKVNTEARFCTCSLSSLPGIKIYPDFVLAKSILSNLPSDFLWNIPDTECVPNFNVFEYFFGWNKPLCVFTEMDLILVADRRGLVLVGVG